jgi:hypothetical protein
MCSNVPIVVQEKAESETPNTLGTPNLIFLTLQKKYK